MFRSVRGLTLLLILIVGTVPSFAADLTVLARPGPWPVADRSIVYQGKIWFSTAVKGVDHNSADVWSYDPASRKLRFERYLFSQDTGHPVVHGNLLYWPHEDMRVGLGAGIVSVTDGRNWRDLVIGTDDHMMHTHAAAEWQGKLVAAMAGWNSVLAVSDDAGGHWRVLVNDAPKTGSFHRYNDIAALGDRLFVRHWQSSGLSLAEYRDGRVVPVEGWPQTRHFSRFTRFAGALYTLVDDENGNAELWRIGADGPARIDLDPAGLTLRHLVSDGELLWIVSAAKDGGQLWSSTDGSVFAPGDRFFGGRSHSAAAAAGGAIYITGEGADGRSIVWGPRMAATAAPDEPPPLPRQTMDPDPDFDAMAETERLARLLTAVEAYQSHGRPLRDALQAALAKRPGPGFFGTLFRQPVPHLDVAIFGGRYSATAPDMAMWHILAAMARNGEATIPIELLQRPWTRPSNRPQKWFDPSLIAMHAVQLTGQNDRTTVATLIERLDRPDDPDWLQSQVTGTLSAITGKPFAYDRKAWKEWWSSVQEFWPHNQD